MQKTKASTTGLKHLDRKELIIPIIKTVRLHQKRVYISISPTIHPKMGPDVSLRYWLPEFTTQLKASSQYSDVIMSTMVCQITSVSIVYLNVCSDADQRKHQISASLAFVRGIHLWIPHTKGQ